MQDNLFAKLPIALIKCGLLCELKSTSVVIYNVLLSYADFNTGKCFPSIKTIHKLTGYSKTTIIQGIKELEDWGLIEVTRRQGSHNVYQLQYWWGRKATGTKTWTGGVQILDRGACPLAPLPSCPLALTTTNNKNHINRTNVVQRTGSSKDSATSQAKKLVYQLRIADIQQQLGWFRSIDSSWGF